MSRLQRRKLAAYRRGIYVFRWPNTNSWFIHQAGDPYPHHVGGSRREAINLAYRCSIAKRYKLEVTYE